MVRTKRKQQPRETINNPSMVQTKRKQQPLETINNPSNSKNARQSRYGKLREKKVN